VKGKGRVTTYWIHGMQDKFASEKATRGSDGPASFATIIPSESGVATSEFPALPTVEVRRSPPQKPAAL
ncbi:hypothetical protein T484DRAFT_1800628, partial [Baffinella frigidus]